MARSFEELVAEAEAEAVSVEGWDFSWLDGRAPEERPSWGYQRVMVPGFTVERYRERLRELDELMRREGAFVARTTRFLIEARKA